MQRGRVATVYLSVNGCLVITYLNFRVVCSVQHILIEYAVGSMLVCNTILHPGFNAAQGDAIVLKKFIQARVFFPLYLNDS